LVKEHVVGFAPSSLLGYPLHNFLIRFPYRVHCRDKTVKRKRFSTRVVLLDWDGTLLNSYAADVRAYRHMFRAMGIRWSLREWRLNYTPNWYAMYEAAGIVRARWPEANRVWRMAIERQRPPLLQGAKSVLRLLDRDFVLGIVTSGSRDRVKRQIARHRLAEHFSTCVYSEDSVKKKPHPAPLQIALKRLRAAPEECVYVGDAPEDIEMARRAGLRAIGIPGPFPTADRLRAAKPELLLRSIRELPDYLRAIAPHS
jgi:HAD superfamily hydrolase (TIGR01509 family)